MSGAGNCLLDSVLGYNTFSCNNYNQRLSESIIYYCVGILANSSMARQSEAFQSYLEWTAYFRFWNVNISLKFTSGFWVGQKTLCYLSIVLWIFLNILRSLLCYMIYFCFISANEKMASHYLVKLCDASFKNDKLSKFWSSRKTTNCSITTSMIVSLWVLIVECSV